MNYKELNDGMIIENNTSPSYIYHKKNGDKYIQYGFGDDSKVIVTFLDEVSWSDYFEDFVEKDQIIKDKKLLRVLIKEVIDNGLDDYRGQR